MEFFPSGNPRPIFSPHKPAQSQQPAAESAVVLPLRVAMPTDPVPGLLARAADALEAEFSALPPLDSSCRFRRDGRRSGRGGPSARRQLPLLSSPLCRANAQAAPSGGPRSLCAGHEHQPEQPRPRWRPRQLRDGDGGGRGNRPYVRLDRISRPLDLRRHHGQPRSAMGGRAARAGQTHRRLRPGALHTQPHLRRVEARLHGDRRRPARAHGPRSARRRAAQGRCRHGCCHARHHGHRRRRSAG